MADFNSYKQERLVKFYDNSYIKDFIDNNNLSTSFVADNFTCFDECLSSLEECEKCKGFELCKQKKKGEVVGLDYDGILTNTIICCKHYLFNRKLEDLKSRFVYSDIPTINYDLSLNNIVLDEDEIKNLFALCYNIFDGTTNNGLYIYGDLGVGKTYMCIALANSLVKANKKVSFIKINDFVTKMSQLIRDDAYEYEKLVNRIKKSDYLILDDIGSESVTEFSRDRLLFNILDYRMENKLCTIFTSNLDLNGLLKHYELETNSLKAKRLLERIDILTDKFCLSGINKRRISQ